MQKYIAPVRFETGYGVLDEQVNMVPELGHLFNAINLNHLAKVSKESGGHPIIIPSFIEVGLFTDFDNNLSYAVRSYKELDQGSMRLSDFVVRQTIAEMNGVNVMSIIDEHGATLTELSKPKSMALALLADFYRLAHSF